LANTAVDQLLLLRISSSADTTSRFTERSQKSRLRQRPEPAIFIQVARLDPLGFCSSGRRLESVARTRARWRKRWESAPCTQAQHQCTPPM